MARQTVAVALPSEELAPVARELAAAGYDVVPVDSPEEFGALLESRRDFAVAILDGETRLRPVARVLLAAPRERPDIPALMVVSPRRLEQLTAKTTTRVNDEYFTRPYSAESLRWRVEAMLIRAQTVDDGKGPVIQAGTGRLGDLGAAGRRSSASSTRRAASARRRSRRTSPRPSRSGAASASCSSTPTR